MKHIGNLEITKDNEKEFANLIEVTGDLRVYGSAKLEALQTVGGDLCVDGSAKLEALQTVGGYLRVYGSAKLEAPNIKEKELPQEQRNEITRNAKKQNTDAFERQGYVLADGILQRIVSKKKSKVLTVYKTKKLTSEDTAYIVFDGQNYSHGKTLEHAKNDLMFKLSSRDTSEFKKWKLTDKKPVEDLIKAYRAITGACEFGTKHFCESQKLKPKYTIKEVITMTSGQYGHEQFKGFFA
jgi:hypothetical protein